MILRVSQSQYLLDNFRLDSVMLVKGGHQPREARSCEYFTDFNDVLNLVEHVKNKWLILDLLCQDPCRQFVVPNCGLLGNNLELP